VHVAFAIDGNFLPWCAVAIKSCIEKASDPLTVHVLHDGSLERDAGLHRLAEMVRAGGAMLVPHAVDSADLGPLPAVDRWGLVVWLRFLLPELLPDVDRVLYLDADVLIAGPLEPVLAVDLFGSPLGAVANVVQPSDVAHVRTIGIEDERRFLNSGVLLMDLDAWRAEGAGRALLEAARTRASDLKWPDQDVLNLVFAGRWLALHPRWNAQNTLWAAPDLAARTFGPSVVEEARRSPAIVHFEGPHLCKPWHALSSHPWREAWWQTLRRTPWSATPPEDAGAVTTALRLLPEQPRIRAYAHLLRWRAKREALR
jgi:lipopolysaccharide biosynthesis glycosyltransferase